MFKFVNTKACKLWEEDDKLWGEWSDLSADDDERYTHSAIIITKSVPITDDMVYRLEEEINDAFDEWVRETRT